MGLNILFWMNMIGRYMYLDLKRDNFRYFRIDDGYLESYKSDLVSLVDGLDFMQTMMFVRKMMMSRCRCVAV